MYKIGDFSKIVDIPVRTLRYYDDCGVLKPSEIDNFTGYRYYSNQNITECKYIKLLKSLNFTLEEIIKYKNSLDEEIISKKKKELEEQMYLIKKQYNKLTCIEQELKKNSTIKNINESPKEKVLRRKYEKRNIRKIA